MFFPHSYLGLSDTLPVTSYFKMIDIWMLFTMIVPFLEVIHQTTIEVFTKSRAAPPFLNQRVDVINVKPGKEDQEVKTGNNIFNWIASILLPVSSLIFAFVFWTVGIIASYSDGNNTNHNMTECLSVQPNEF